jgi:polyisoprenoid-binding protein YceI
MAIWIFEPGHTEAEFRAVHMMVTWVRGFFKDIHGWMEFDWDRCMASTFEGRIDAMNLYTGEPDRDAHLRSPDFFDAENQPEIRFKGRFTERIGDTRFKAIADLTIRDRTNPIELDATYVGQWETPFWVGDENRGTMRRMGWQATGTLNRQDFDVSWQDELPGGGRVVSDEILLELDAEAINLEDLEKTGAIEHYRDDVPPVEARAGSPQAGG